MQQSISNNPEFLIPEFQTHEEQKHTYLGEQRRQELLLLLPGRQALLFSLAIAPLLQEAMDGLLHQLHLPPPPPCLLLHTDASIQGVVSPVGKVHGGENDDAEEGMIGEVALSTNQFFSNKQ